MKNTKIKVIATVMSALMLTGCADKIPTYDSVANGKASVAVEKADAPKPVEVQPAETKPVDSKADEAKKAEKTKKAAATTTTTATTATTTNILTGNFYEINGNRVTLEIDAMADGTYFAKVLESNGCNDCFQYGMTCTANGSVLSYECGSYNLHK